MVSIKFTIMANNERSSYSRWQWQHWQAPLQLLSCMAFYLCKCVGKNSQWWDLGNGNSIAIGDLCEGQNHGIHFIKMRVFWANIGRSRGWGEVTANQNLWHRIVDSVLSVFSEIKDVNFSVNSVLNWSMYVCSSDTTLISQINDIFWEEICFLPLLH